MPAASPTTCHETVRGLGSRQDAAALKLLGEAAQASDQFVRQTAIEVIGRHPLGRSSQSAVLNALRDPSEYAVRTACDVVAGWTLWEAHDLVVVLLNSASGATRQSAICALATVWIDADFPLPLRIYQRDPQIDVRRQAARVLRRGRHIDKLANAVRSLPC